MRSRAEKQAVVSSAEVAAHPTHRIDAEYWQATPEVRAEMDEGRTRVNAENRVKRRHAKNRTKDDAVRFVLDGLGVGSLTELHRLVERGRRLGDAVDLIDELRSRDEYFGARASDDDLMRRIDALDD